MNGVSTLEKLLRMIPPNQKSKKTRAFALVTVGENGEVDISIAGMSQQQFRNEILPIVIGDETKVSSHFN